MLKISTLASGSSGNCAVVSDGRVHILIDAGISARRIVAGLDALGVDPESVSAILVTHEHADHISGLRVLCKRLAAPIYTAAPTARQIAYRVAGLDDRFRTFQPGQSFALGNLEVRTFPTSHDCACPVGYTISTAAEKLAFCTDLGVVTPEVRQAVYGARLLVAECNYDPDLLRSGPYPAMLKERILGDLGHLSNQKGAELASWAVEHGTRRVVLAHLSKENNRPQLALETAAGILETAGVRVGSDVDLLAAPRGEPTGWMEV